MKKGPANYNIILKPGFHGFLLSFSINLHLIQVVLQTSPRMVFLWVNYNIILDTRFCVFSQMVIFASKCQHLEAQMLAFCFLNASILRPKCQHCEGQMLACCARNASILRPKCQHLQTNCLQLQEKCAVLGPSNDVVRLQNVQFEVVDVVVSI